MNRRENVKLAEMCVAQGGKARKTKSGWLVTHPSGQTVAWHDSPTSDTRRGDKNIIAALRRAGFAPANRK